MMRAGKPPDVPGMMMFRKQADIMSPADAM